MFKAHLVARHARTFASLALAGLLVLASFPAASIRPVSAQQSTGISPDIPVIPPGSAYRQTNLVSDVPGAASILDPLLVNAWGVAFLATSPFWVANAGSSSATLYGGDVSGSPFVKNPMNVTIPGAVPPGGLPTGIVSSASATDFTFTGGGSAGPARFIFASILGNITAWKGGLTTAVVVATPPGVRVYTGLAIGTSGGANFLYAADFANKKIDVFDKNFALTALAGSFTDPTIPADFTPHNIQNLAGKLYVEYAKIDPITLRDQPGPGNGFISVFDTSGIFLGRLVSNGPLSSPWGVAIAPATFGVFPNALLVGNFGNGQINAFNSTTGAFLGTLQNEAGHLLAIDGLWALTFGNGAGGGDVGTLYFSAGPVREEHGLFGSLKPTTATATSLIQFAQNDFEQFGPNDFVVGENGGFMDITVTRLGNVSGAATVNYATVDSQQVGQATQKSDYEIAAGKLTFSPGQTTKTFRVLIVNDNVPEVNEAVGLVLSNPTGTGVGLGDPNVAILRITDDDALQPAITVRSFEATDAAGITPIRDSFRSDIGGGTSAGANGSFGGLRREINWDGVPAAFAAPNNFPPNFFNVNSPRGVVLSSPGSNLQVSGDSADAGAGQPAAANFGNINATYTATFKPFSAQRLFTAVSNNVVDVNFFVPGSAVPATVNSFGVVFTDVDGAFPPGGTRMQFFDVNDLLITEQTANGLTGNGNFAFVGVTISNRPIRRVRIISGNAPLGQPDSPPGRDLVVMDDFIYSEPVAVAPTFVGPNPIDDSAFFVRQQYLDFLNRQPDPSGFNFWVNNIESCGANAQCRDVKRTDTSAAFFLSTEFQRGGLLAYLANKAAFNAVPLYGVFERDSQALQKDLILGTPSFDAQLEANKQAYFNDFVARPDFVAAYPTSQTNAQYVEALLANAGIAPSRFVVNLTNTQEVPPTNPTLSGGGSRPGSYGTATFQINAAQDAMTFTATINNIDFTGSQTSDTNDNLIAAHVHAGPTVAPGVNGPVVWGFFGTPFNDNTPNDVVNTPFAAPGVGSTISGKWDAPEGNATTLAAQLSNILAGRAYINFHTNQFGGGEVRGNFPATLAFRDSLVNGLNAIPATETRATVLRKIAESQPFFDIEVNRAFVFMEYFGYLRRDPDQAGFNFWFDKLNTAQGNFTKADMVKAFIISGEYRQRFGPG